VKSQIIREPSIDDLLAEPIIHALMKADGVTVDQIKDIIAQARPPGAVVRPDPEPPASTLSSGCGDGG
jgi:hypothetical protein